LYKFQPRFSRETYVSLKTTIPGMQRWPGELSLVIPASYRLISVGIPLVNKRKNSLIYVK
jgi:hypothetical protein